MLYVSEADAEDADDEDDALLELEELLEEDALLEELLELEEFDELEELLEALEELELLAAAALTLIENAGMDVVVLLSLTEMTMLLYVPMAATVGVPRKRPVAVLKRAHAGLLTILKPSASPSTSRATGLKS